MITARDSTEGEAPPDPITKAGRNCWRRERAGRVAFLIDGADYFAAVAAAFERAEESILIVGWDVHSRTRLRRDKEVRELPDDLGALLNALAARRRHLHTYVLDWDFAVVYALDRESPPLFNFDWRRHRRVHFHLDGDHPIGGCHHQKIVVVDDKLAFVGGLDLTSQRWDTRDHAADNPERIDPSGKPYRPFHDVQMAVDGDAAAALGELVRERWRRTCGSELRPPNTTTDPWPEGLSVDVENVDVAIARTEPEWQGRSEVREVEQLYLDAIDAARSCIYIENQYITSAAVGDALQRRLGEPDGPEIIMVTTRECAGWLEEVAMGVLRARLLRRLRAADQRARLRVLYPMTPGITEAGVNVHAKVLVVDDTLVRIGSSNMSNRSMGLDSECDLAIESQGRPEVAAAISRFRNELLAEHLGVPRAEVEDELRSQPSIARLIEQKCGGEHTLCEVAGDVEPWLDELVPQQAILDPEKPVDAEKLIEQFLPDRIGYSNRHPLLAAALVLLSLIALASLWRWTPLGDWLRSGVALDWIRDLTQGPLGSVAAVTVFVAGSLAMIPVTLLIGLTALALGPWPGFACSLLASLISATVSFAIGRVLWRGTVRRLGGRRLNRVSRRLAKRGVLAIVAVRIVPVAPFTVVNLVAGSSRIGFRDYFIGTLAAMTPGILIMSLLAHEAVDAIRAPSWASVLTVTVLIAALFGSGLWLRHLLRKRGLMRNGEVAEK